MNTRTGELTTDPKVIEKWLTDGDKVARMEADLSRRLSLLHPPTPLPISYGDPDDKKQRRRVGVGGRVAGSFKVRRR